MERPVPLILQWDETFDIGADTGTPVDDQDYHVSFTLTTKLNMKLMLNIDRPKLTPEDEKQLLEAAESAPDRKKRRVITLPAPRGAGRCILPIPPT